MIFMIIQPLSDLTTDLLILNSAQSHEKEVIEAVFERPIDEIATDMTYSDGNFRYKTFDLNDALDNFSRSELEEGRAFRRHTI